jgi:glycosyltransferase involved in cell wall biosynthesis
VRVLHLITRLPIGGAERLLVDIVSRLDRSRYDSVVCCIQEKGELAVDLEASGVPVSCLHRMQSKGFDIRVIADLVRLLRRDRIGLVHSHLYHANLYGRIAALLAGVPVVATIHNTYARRKLHRRVFNNLLSRVSARVIAVSEEIRRDVMQYDWIAPDRIATIHNGIDVGRIETRMTRRQARERLGIADRELVIGCIGRLEEQKGHRYLLEALAMLNEDGRLAGRLRLVLAGDGRLQKDLRERASALGVAQWTSFLGTRRDIAEILKALDIFVMPSLWEGLSVAMLEAMAAGLPVVISDVGGVSQALGENQYGIKVPAGSPADLASAIRLLAEDPDRRASLGSSARKRVLASFSADAMMAELDRVYEEALRK